MVHFRDWISFHNWQTHSIKPPYRVASDQRQAEAEAYPEGSDVARRFGFQTMLNVPLIRASGEAIG
jgi:hypothetical protein